MERRSVDLGWKKGLRAKGVANLFGRGSGSDAKLFIKRYFVRAMRRDHGKGLQFRAFANSSENNSPLRNRIPRYNRGGNQSCPVAGAVFKTAERPFGRRPILLRLAPRLQL